MIGTGLERGSYPCSLRSVGLGAIACALVLGCHRELPGGDGEAAGTGPQSTTEDDGPGATSTSTQASDDSSTGAMFDIGPWVGRHHYEWPFSPFGEVNNTNGGTTLANFEIRSDYTALGTYDQCFLRAPIEIEYAIEPLAGDRIRLTPGSGETSLRYMAGLEVDEIQLTLDEACGVITFELTGEPWGPDPVTEDLWHPGAAWWVDRCMSKSIEGETTFQIDYCDGEEPPPCP